MAPVGRDSFNHAGPMVAGWNLVDVLPGLEQHAAKYIETAAHDDKPFFLYLPLTSPHYPVVPSAEFQGKSSAGEFGDFVMQTDRVLGTVLDALQRGGVAEKTLVIFTSDNGGVRYSSMGGLAGVNRGSDLPARFVELRWTPDGKPRGTAAGHRDPRHGARGCRPRHLLAPPARRRSLPRSRPGSG